jgi:glutamine amidotransferase
MSAARVCILDYGAGNVGSVFNALVPLAANVKISNAPADVADATHVVLPGVGAFAAAMSRIKERFDLDRLDRDVRRTGKPFLGICVGLQVLADRGHEFGVADGLGWLKGEVRRIEAGDLPLPHVGWNSIESAVAHPLLRRFPTTPDFYFLHSYCWSGAHEAAVAARCKYGESFACVLAQDNVMGVQFHPEKSQKAGRVLLENFLAM